jgi:hypothetical protein
MNRLKSYVRRTVLQSAREYSYPAKRRTVQGTTSALIDASRGTDTGWWTDLIYTVDVLRLAHQYRKDIATALEEYRDAVGEDYVFISNGGGQEVTTGRILSALLHGKPYTLEEYRDGREGFGPDAAAIGIRFAIEWYVSRVAGDLGVDL